MLPYLWMIFSGVMLIVYCINGRSAIMSLYLQYRNTDWLILKNIKDYICPRKSKLPPERYNKHPYFHVRKNPIIRNSGQRLMCLNSSGLQSTDIIKFDSNSVDVFLNICVTAGATPFKQDFLPDTFVPKIENMEGLGGKLTIHGYGAISYRVQTDDRHLYRLQIGRRYRWFMLRQPVVNFVCCNLLGCEKTKFQIRNKRLIVNLNCEH